MYGQKQREWEYAERHGRYEEDATYYCLINATFLQPEMNGRAADVRKKEEEKKKSALDGSEDVMDGQVSASVSPQVSEKSDRWHIL